MAVVSHSSAQCPSMCINLGMKNREVDVFNKIRLLTCSCSSLDFTPFDNSWSHSHGRWLLFNLHKLIIIFKNLSSTWQMIFFIHMVVFYYLNIEIYSLQTQMVERCILYKRISSYKCVINCIPARICELEWLNIYKMERKIQLNWVKSSKAHGTALYWETGGIWSE